MNKRPLLDSIAGSEDVQSLTLAELEQLSEEVRAELLEVVLNNGGHLASNLGTVELTISLLHAFTPPADKLVWDTGHQSYTYKLLTGRRKLFQQLRKDDGCCGFLSRAESEYDCFGAGHAGTAISAAVGMAFARDQRQGDEKVVAIVGDGALGTGVALEGLNQIIENTDDLVVVLNDNKMSIAPNVGAIAQHLNRIISGEFYNRLKAKAGDTVERIPFIGNQLKRRVKQVEEVAKGMLVPGLLFEELGLRYIGPINGHDLEELTETFNNIRNLKQPLLIHVLTEKGHGYPAAEEAPEKYHGVSKAPEKETLLQGNDEENDRREREEEAGCQKDNLAKQENPSFSVISGTIIEKMMEEDDKIIAITAGMCKGTGLENVRGRYSQRYLDVGIAEEHAVVSAAGIAAEGYKPIVSIYATFIQRAMDYVFHDVCLQQLPVVFCLDRAGVVNDGPTHHGIHDLAFWRSVPYLSVLQPADSEELTTMMNSAVSRATPVIIRYPKGDAAMLPENQQAAFAWGRAAVLVEGTDVALWCSGREVKTGLETAAILKKEGVNTAVINARFLRPFDEELLFRFAADMPIAVVENHVDIGGLGSIVRETLADKQNNGIYVYAWPGNVPIPYGTEAGLRKKFGLTADAIADNLLTHFSCNGRGSVR
ncbi:MAG: 1-deoxy-D-xylulose-5-phosphate synthase [Verrucomicrobiota bacterium]